ncbi:MAG: DUF4331 domain-containing protein [Jatrophihabitans sp.]
MSSHKEAPGIANDAAADNTDVYAFVSPDAPDTVTLIANFVPLQNPAGGPNFYEFGEDVLYEIHVDNNGDGVPDLTYQFRFTTKVGDPNTFLYNTGPIKSIGDPNWNRKQFYTVSKKIGAAPAIPLTPNNLACPPCNIGPASTPNYGDLAKAAIHTLTTGEKVFAGQRAEGFYVDLGAIFDLGILRPFLAAHLAKMPSAPGINSTKAVNIDTIAIQVPKSDLITGDGTTTTNKNNIIGVYASASRPTALRYNTDGTKTASGAFVQVSRLGNPLFNEVLIPIPKKDGWNSDKPVNDATYVPNVAKPELARLLGVRYPGVFPNLGKYKKDRTDLVAVLLTGVPKGIVPGFDGNYPNAATFPGPVRADLLRLNTAIPPKTNKPSNLGLLGGDVAGFPNGRRVFDDVTTIELRAIAGAILPLVDPSFKSDAAAGAITPGLTSSNTDVTARNTVHYQDTFPYLGTPHSGYRNPSNNDPAPDLGAINRPPSTGTTPVGAPETGLGPQAEKSLSTGLLAGAALAVAGVAGAAGVAARQGVLSGAGSMSARPSPAPRHSAEDSERESGE